MQTRIYSAKWSAAMKQMIAEMSETEYEEWLKEIGSTAPQEKPNGAQSYQITEKDIEEWAKGEADKTQLRVKPIKPKEIKISNEDIQKWASDK